MKCNQCNNELVEGAKFCGSCGSTQDASPAPAPQLSKHCSSCGTELIEGSKFCKSCGQGANSAPASTANPTSNVGNSPKSSNSKLPKKALVGVAAVVGIVVIGVGSTLAGVNPFSSPKATLASAALKTVNSINKEADAIFDQLDIIDYFNTLTTSQYIHDVYVDNENITIYSDYKNKKLRFDMSVYGFDNNIFITDEHITAYSDFVGETYGLNLKRFETELLSSGIIPSELSKTINLDMFEYSDLTFINELDDIFNDNLVKTMKNLDVQKTDKESVFINGASKDLTSYKVTMSPDLIKDFTINVMNDTLANKEILSYLEELYLTIALYSGDYVYMEDFNELLFDFKQVFIDSLDDEFYYLENDFLNNPDEYSITVTLYKGKILQIKTYDNLRILLSIEPKDLSASLIQSGDRVTFALSYLNDVFSLSSAAFGEQVELRYDTKSTKNNFVIKEDNYNLFTASIDTLTPNVFKFDYDDGYDSISLVSRKEKIDTALLTQPTNYTDVLDTLYDIANFSLSDLLYELY